MNNIRPAALVVSNRSKRFIPTARILKRLSSSKSEPLVKFSHNAEAKVGILELNAPASYNALTVEMGSEFQQLINSTKQSMRTGEVDINSIVLQGAGKAFCAGGDLTWLRSLANNSVEQNVDVMRAFYQSFLCLRSVPVPIVAAVHGPAIGAGAALMAACDVRVAASDARIGFNFVKIGIHAGMGASHFLPSVIGQSEASRILLTGDELTGEDGYRIGLISDLVVADQASVKGHAYDIACRIARQGTVAVRSMTQSLRASQEAGLEVALMREAHAQAMCYARTSDWYEGLDSIIERREPVYSSYHDNARE